MVAITPSAWTANRPRKLFREEIWIYQSSFYGEWFKERLKKDTCEWTKPYMESREFAGDQEPRQLVTYTIPIHNSAGRPVALLGADMSLGRLRERLMEDVMEMNEQYEQGHEHQSYLFVVDRDGMLIMHPDKARLMTNYDSRIGRVMKAHRGNCMTEVDGVKSVLYYRNIKHTSWVMVIVTPEDVILSNGLMLNLTILMVMVVGLVVICLFCRQQIKGIADPFAAQKAAQDRELNIAHDIQMSMLPTSLDSGLAEQLELCATLTPARNVGGDLYDYFVRDDSLYFCIGDVSGKGVPAALVMTMTRSAFRLLAESETEVSRIVCRMNDMIVSDKDLSVFITFFIGVLDLKTGHLSYCNAGHKAPYLLQKEGGGLSTLPVERNLPVGAMPDWTFTSQETTLAPGTTLFLYTDGLDEAEDARHQMFGKERIKELLSSSSATACHELVERMTQAVADFVGGNEQSDDLTMMAMRVKKNRVKREA